MHLILGFMVALSITMVLIPPLMRAAGRFNFLDQPESRKVHTHAIPRVGGIAMAAGMLIAIVAWGDSSRTLQAYCAGIVVLLVFGIWDDRVTLGAGTKLIGQAIAVLIAMTWGDVNIASVTFSERYVLPEWVSGPLTFIFLIGATNAINLADGLDGLAGGVAVFCLSALALLSLTVGNTSIGSTAIVAIGAVLGFLRFNTHPARVFMGDSGSQILGFCVAVLSVLLTQDPGIPLSTALPLLLLGVPIIDTSMVMIERMMQGHSPFKADRTHIHHRLLRIGFDHHEAVMVIYALQALLFICAWYMRYDGDVRIIGVFAAFAGLIVATLRIAESRCWRLRTAPAAAAAQRSMLGRYIAWLRTPERLPYWSTCAIGLAVLVYESRVLFSGTAPSPDVRLLAAIAAVVLGLSTLLRYREHNVSWLDRSAIYICAVMAVYLDERSSGASIVLHYLEWIVFAAIAIGLVIHLKLASNVSFKVTPLDLLVILMALLVPNLPGSIATPQQLGVAIVKLVLLLYAIETFVTVVERRWKLLNVAALCFLAGIAVVESH